MNRVPLLFAETVARLIDDKSVRKLKETTSGLFRTAGRSLWENLFDIYLSVVYNSTAKTFEYCLTCGPRLNGNRNSRDGPEEPYTYDPADLRFVRYFGVSLYSNELFRHPKFTWMSATPSDQTLLKLLRTPCARSFLDLNTKCPEFLKLLPGYCTFNCIYAPNVYNEVLDAIIQRSQECGRLESLVCTEFFRKRGREASTQWIATNKRLRYVSYNCVVNPDSIDSVLTSIGVD